MSLTEFTGVSYFFFVLLQRGIAAANLAAIGIAFIAVDAFAFALGFAAFGANVFFVRHLFLFLELKC